LACKEAFASALKGFYIINVTKCLIFRSKSLFARAIRGKLYLSRLEPTFRLSFG
jgi:hypothetical protein